MKEKTFRLLKVGDKIYRTMLTDSRVNKNAAGGAEMEFIVKEIEQLDFYTFRLTLNQLKVDYKNEFREDEDTENRILVLEVEGNSSIKCVETKKKDPYNLAINNIFYCTSKKQLAESVNKVIRLKQEKAKKIKEYAVSVLNNLQIAAMEAAYMNFKEEEEQEKLEEEMAQEMDMELAASMAL